MEILIGYKVVIVFIWFMLIFIGEKLYHSASYPSSLTKVKRYRRLGRNLSVSAINIILSPIVIIPLTVYISGFFTSWRPEWMQQTYFFIFDLLILDFFLYWWHRFSHHIPILWRFHEVHHLDEFLDSSTALRFHFGEVFISSVVRICFIALFSIPLTSVILFEIILLVCTIFNHSNLRLSPYLESKLSNVLVTPSIHWVHHHAKQKDTDSNYATIFSGWDKYFGTRNKKIRWENMKIGVEQAKELSLFKLLLRPINV